jgi:hypothetical protein
MVGAGTAISASGPNAENERLLAYEQEAFATALKSRARFDNVWPENDRFFLNDQWKRDRPKWRSAPVTNFCRSGVLPMIALLTDNRPHPEPMALDPGLSQLQAALGAAVDFVFDDQDVPILLPQVLLTGAINGSSFMGLSHNPLMPTRLGLREIDCYDTFALGGSDIDTSSHFWTREWMSLAQIRVQFPEQGARVMAEEPDSAPRQRPREIMRPTIEDAPSFRVSSGGLLSGRPGRGSDEAMGGEWNQHGKGAWVYQFYYKDPRPGPGGKPVYPTFRWITKANGVVLKDRPLEQDFACGLIPVVKWNNFSWSNEFWGASELHDIKRLNVLHNLVFGLILDLIRLGACPPLLVPSLSGLDVSKFVVRPGMVCEYDSNYGEPHWMSPVQVSPTMVNMLALIETYIRTMTGSGEISEGALPFKGASGVLVAQLRELSQTRVRMKSRALESFMKKIGERVMYAIQQFWTVEDTIPIVGEVSPAKVARFHPETVHMDEQSMRAFLRINQIVDINAQNGEYVRLNDLRAGRFLMRVHGISGLPLSRRARMLEGMELKKAEVLDAEAVMEYADIPEPIKWRMQQRKAEAMAAQQAAAQAQPVAPPTGASPENPAPPPESIALPLGPTMGSNQILPESGLGAPAPDQMEHGGQIARVNI